MPAVSQAQRRFFRWAEKHPQQAGVKKSVAHEFNASDKGGKLPERVKNGKPTTSRGEKWYGSKG